MQEPSDPIRVLHVLGELRPSGAETMLATAAPIFMSLGVAGEILSTGSRPGIYADRLRDKGYVIHHVPFSKTPGFFLDAWRVMRRGFDAVHVHTERAAFWLSWTALLAGARVIVKSVHSAYEFRGNLRVRRTVQRQVMRLMGVRQVAIGDTVREVERRFFLLETELIRNWYDRRRFRPPSESEREQARRALGLDPNAFVLGCVGNCAPVKNHVELIRAVALLPKAERPVVLHVGEEESSQSERELARALEVSERVKFLGPRQDVEGVLRACDGFAMPSVREGVGIAVIEALASGLPVVLSNASGLRDFAMYFDGLIYAEPRAEALAEGIRRLVGMPLEERRRLARLNASRAEAIYSAEAGTTAYARMYRGYRTLPREGREGRDV